ncbi:uncharacterized protein VDAG_04612 [Verticillium dahliae VdLs.17]|uniref:Methyltransferase type 11 domain-containing protein n=1 Tax=Verticillium dahliae (strain VdLs.17 / ATCC MYA-4575 / FGSC 10137) TaxID=498257 RepID=G2X3M5_VERDV|nr:uncharacterized protein VDAG_04612 [Verticillium dahliae VdLs.17]EGY23174.1 hypothetical protein VDAG_04612 [Verticillium dahliae VdLs.17]KAH6682453.1 hypothetical protein EV126DRAFT_394647 [Verticillium dahliae]KAH6689308.1 hypothetical protein EV126DRAFT_370443 [Verticillium dahliae]
MWEVVWTDPDKESRREHRERKAIQKEQKDKDRVTTGSVSTRSVSPSESRTFGFFGSKSSKRSTTPKPESSAPTLASSTDDSKVRRVSCLSSTPSTAASPPTSDLLAAAGTFSSSADPLTSQLTESLHDSPESSTRGLLDSVFSRWTDTSLPPASPSTTSMADSTTKTTHYIQTLGPSSFITKDTKVTVSPRTCGDDITGVVSVVRISADPVREAPPTPPRSPATVTSISMNADTPISLFPGQFSPPSKLPIARVPSWTSKFKPNNPDAWKPPDAWECVPSPETRASTFEDIMEDPTEAAEEGLSLSLNLSGVQREVKSMAVASPETRLVRLTESWGVSDEANLYKELEMEKKRWMLSSLDNLDKPIDIDPAKHVPWKITAAKAKKVLALYESQATTSYLAALHYTKNIYHMSPTPLSHRLFPNIHPVAVPAISPSTFPVGPGLFGAVYSLSLPSLVPSPDVPAILKSVHRCLSMGGTFHLTLIDPLPSTTTLGPLLRAWLDEHLLFNLERNFRCMNPSKLFPIWLADASLRAEGSTITTVKFLAVASPDPEGVEAEGLRRSERSVKQELRSLVGRLLWMDVWGNYIAADGWWWDDPAIVQECQQMRTSWEYCVIEAVKDV